MANERKIKGASHNLVQRLLSTSSCLSTKKVWPVSGSKFPWIRPVPLQQVSRLASSPEHYCSKIQKVLIIIKGSIIQCLTYQPGRQCQDHEGSTDDVSALSTLGRVVRTMGSNANALSTDVECWNLFC
jgi:molybdenum cofactor biosynthesis enzyme MoaA